MDKALKYTDYLMRWQADTYENIDTSEDVIVFNVIGTIVGLVNAELLSVGAVVDFVKLLSIGKEVKDRIFQVHNEAVDSVNEKH